MRIGVRASQLNDWEWMDRLNDGVDGMFDYVSNNGGWKGVMWSKPGTIQDQAANQGNNTNPYTAPPPVYVQSGALQYHLVSLVPATLMALDPIPWKASRLTLLLPILMPTRH